jgi:predicted nucleic acid-binding protein
MIILDTGCIDSLFDEKYKDFSESIKKSEDDGKTITTTIFNYAERESGFKHLEQQGSVSDKKRYLWRKILDFFDILKKNNDLLYPSEETAKIYAELHFNLKNNREINISKGELKNMHNDLWIASLCIENDAKLYSMDKDMLKIRSIDDRLDIEIVDKK